MRPRTHSDRITMRNGSHNRVFRARAAAIMPGDRVCAGQLWCGAAGKTDYDKFSDPPGDVT